MASPACPSCGVWLCADCGWKRNNASRYSEQNQHCARCGSLKGKMLPVHHYLQSKYEDHLEVSKSWKLSYPLKKGEK